MTRFLTGYLVVTGALTLLVLTVPGLLMVGIVVLVVPGLVLAAMPTAFLYGLVVAVAWFPLRRAVGAWGAAAAGVALVGAVATLPQTVVDPYVLRRVEEARAGDRRPEGRLAISGVLSVGGDEQRRFWSPTDRRNRYTCTNLCLAALLSPGIRGVVVDRPGHEARSGARPNTPAVFYRLVRESGCASTARFDGGGFPFEGGPNLVALHERGALVLAGGACLVSSDEIPAADWTIRYGRETLHDAPPTGSLVGRIERARLSVDAGSQRRLQRSAVSYSLLSPWLWLKPFDWITTFDWSRSRVDYAAVAFEPFELLAASTDLVLRDPGEPVTDLHGRTMREVLAAALDDPSLPSDAPAFDLVSLFFETFKGEAGAARPIGPDDTALVVRIIADPRVERYRGLWEPIHALGPAAGVLRAPMVARILQAAIPDGRPAAEDLGGDLGSLPEGTFAQPLPDEEQLLADPVRRRWAARFIERQADRGAAAAPDLLRIIAQSYERKREADRAGAPGGTEDATAARTALCLIGPDAAPALPALEALMADGTIPESALGADGWQYTLARLGKPVADIVKPSRSRLTQEEFERRTETALRDLGAIKCRR